MIVKFEFDTDKPTDLAAFKVISSMFMQVQTTGPSTTAATPPATAGNTAGKPAGSPATPPAAGKPAAASKPAGSPAKPATAAAAAAVPTPEEIRARFQVLARTATPIIASNTLKELGFTNVNSIPDDKRVGVLTKVNEIIANYEAEAAAKAAESTEDQQQEEDFS